MAGAIASSGRLDTNILSTQLKVHRCMHVQKEVFCIKGVWPIANLGFRQTMPFDSFRNQEQSVCVLAKRVNTH